MVDGLWADRSSQYSSVLLALNPGLHELEVVVLPVRPHDQQARGLNKFKLLEILVYEHRAKATCIIFLPLFVQTRLEAQEAVAEDENKRSTDVRTSLQVVQ